MKSFLLLIILFLSLSFNVLACNSFGNSGDGCAEKVLGVQTEEGVKVEITTAGTNWYTGHVCSGTKVVQFSGTELEKQAALSIAMASYMADKGPIYFRCNQKISDTVCGCSNIALGQSWRD